MRTRTLCRLAVMGVAAALVAGCGGNKAKEEAEQQAARQLEFEQTQPLESGMYRAVHYDISGDKGRKGSFDGRMLVALTPDQSVMYVYENGNRAKIDYRVIIEKPFEHRDSLYGATDTSGNPVTLKGDSTQWTLAFDRNGQTVAIELEKTPMSTAPASEMMQRIATALQKK